MAFLNLDLDFFAHPKCARLVGLIGRDSEVFPLRLWAYTAKYHSVDGKLSGYSPQAIERIVQWGGQPGQCVDALAAVGFIDKIGESEWKVHDWVDYQGHIHALKLRNKKVARNRWKSIRKAGITVDTSGIPKQNSGIPQSLPIQSLPIQQEIQKQKKPPSGTENPEIPTFPPGSRNEETNPRSLGVSPRGIDTNPRFLETNQRSKSSGKDVEIPPDLLQSEPEIRDWLAYKAERREAYKPSGIGAFWRTLRLIPPERRRAAIDRSMAAGWRGIFDEKGGSNGYGKNHRGVGEAATVAGKYDHLG